jgi:hypothetical protein
MTRLSLLVVAVLGACLVLAGTAYADETETPTPVAETPPPVETAVAPAPVETATAPADETPPPDAEIPPAEETLPPTVPPRTEEPPLTPAPDGEDLIIAPAPVEPAPGTGELIVAPPTTGAGSPSGSSWPWWPLAIAGAAAAGTAGLLLAAYQGRRARP